MNTKRISNVNRMKNFGLAACAIMALGVMTGGEAAAQCRLSGGNTGYGYNSGYGSNVNYGNSRNYGSSLNNRLNTSYNNGYGMPSTYQRNSTQRPTLNLGLTYNSNRDSGYGFGYGNSGNGNYNTGAYGRRTGYGSSYSSNSQRPVAYRHGDHVDFETSYGRQHLIGRGF